MVDDGRRRSMREYQKRRSLARREHGLTTRTTWIREEDTEAYKIATAPLADHARLIEAIIGSVTVEAVEIVEIIRRHKLPYDPEDLIFLTRVAEELALRPREQKATIQRAEEIIARYGFHLKVDDLLR
jgi:hypothetical protein